MNWWRKGQTSCAHYYVRIDSQGDQLRGYDVTFRCDHCKNTIKEWYGYPQGSTRAEIIKNKSLSASYRRNGND